jgi:hypothetical protein
MNEEIEYAEMLEIPLSTVNVERKRRKNKKWGEKKLKDTLIERVNDRLENSAEPPLAIEEEGELLFDSSVERIDTVRLYSEGEERSIFNERLQADDFPLEEGKYIRPTFDKNNLAKKIIKGEFAAICLLCGGIFLTNVFLPNSAINTFFRALNNPVETNTDAREYNEFVLSSIVGEYSSNQVTLSKEGVLSFTGEGCVYPIVDGKVLEASKTEEGYTVKIAHSDNFSEVILGLDYLYYEVGDEVKANVPIGYSSGEREVQVSMYSQKTLLNCFELSEDNELNWVVSES